MSIQAAAISKSFWVFRALSDVTVTTLPLGSPLCSDPAAATSPLLN